MSSRLHYVCVQYSLQCAYMRSNKQLSPAPVVGCGLELAVDYLYPEPDRAGSP